MEKGTKVGSSGIILGLIWRNLRLPLTETLWRCVDCPALPGPHPDPGLVSWALELFDHDFQV